VPVHLLLWYLLTIRLLLYQLLHLWRLLIHSPLIFQHPLQELYRLKKDTNRGPGWHWTNSWRRYPNGILLWLVLQPKYRISNKKLCARTLVSMSTVW
jgi:hypothetical protein